MNAPSSNESAPAVSISASAAQVSNPGVLDYSLHPSVLSAMSVPVVGGLNLVIPSERDSRVMFVGDMHDLAADARGDVVRFIQIALADGNHARGRQLEAATNWVESTLAKKERLPPGEWPRYQFALEANDQADAFREAIRKQTEPSIQRMVNVVQRVVRDVTPVINVMSTYELKLAWYDVLTQLRDGAQLYHDRVVADDQQTLAVLDRFYKEVPRLPVPASPLPGADRPKAPTPAGEPVATPRNDAMRAPAKPVPQATDSAAGTTGGLLVLLGILGTAAFLFMRLRKRVKNKSSS